MPVQDLTPQLRTRLSRVERGVGWFVAIATLLLLAGFGYYVYHTAESKGWFKIKVPYHTYLKDASGLHVGDHVRLMGFEVGDITVVEGNPAGKNWFTENNYNVYVQFRIQEPYYGYIWTDSHVRIGTADLLGKRYLEITKGTTGDPTIVSDRPLMIYNNKKSNDYVRLIDQPKGYWIQHVDEAPSLTEHVDRIISQVEAALPSFFKLTNQTSGVLSNTAALTARASALIDQAQPLLTNFTIISANLTNSNGSLGQWLIPTNINERLQQTLASAALVLTNTDSNVSMLATGLSKSIENIASLTSNLNAQVQANDKIVSQVSSIIVQADTFMQGLRKHWFLKGAFKSTNSPAPTRRSTPPPKAGKHTN
jgi:ABC-type transporter Mla subunit MlaD